MSEGPVFPLGQLTATPAALALAAEHGLDLGHLVYRHQHGDWGDVDRSDAKANDYARDHEERILSSYGKDTDQHLWIITEADRSVTTVLRPDDY